MAKKKPDPAPDAAAPAAAPVVPEPVDAPAPPVIAAGTLVTDGNLVGACESIDEGGRSFVFQPIFHIEGLARCTGIVEPRHVRMDAFRRFVY